MTEVLNSLLSGAVDKFYRFFSPAVFKMMSFGAWRLGRVSFDNSG